MSDARSYVQLKRELGNWIAEGKYVLPLSAVATSLLMLEGEYADKWLVKGLPISIARSAARYCLQYEWGEEAHEFHFDLYVATKDDVGEDCFFIVGDLQADRVRSVLTDWLFYHPRIGVEPFVLWNKQFHSLLLRLRLSMLNVEFGYYLMDSIGKSRRQPIYKKRDDPYEIYRLCRQFRRYLDRQDIDSPFKGTVDRYGGFYARRDVETDYWQVLLREFIEAVRPSVEQARSVSSARAFQSVTIECAASFVREYLINELLAELHAHGYAASAHYSHKFVTLVIYDEHSEANLEVMVPLVDDYREEEPEVLQGKPLFEEEEDFETVEVYVNPSEDARRGFVLDALSCITSSMWAGGSRVSKPAR